MKLDDLEPKFKEKVEILICNCLREGYELVTYFTIRDPWQQAKFWRQSRPWEQIKSAIEYMKGEGAEWLAEILKSVGPQNGRWATNALPGLSWHNWGLAIDSFVKEEGKAVWKAYHPGYRVYAREAIKLDLVAGYYWRLKDAVHVQEPQEKVLDRYSWPEIDEAMRERFEK